MENHCELGRLVREEGCCKRSKRDTVSGQETGEQKT